MPVITLPIAPWFWPASPSWWKASMTPMTVPSRPTNGALLPSVPSRYVDRSSWPRALASEASSASASARGPPWTQRSAVEHDARLDRPALAQDLARAVEVLDLERLREARRERVEVVGCGARRRPSARAPRRATRPTGRAGDRAPTCCRAARSARDVRRAWLPSFRDSLAVRSCRRRGPARSAVRLARP